MEIVHTYCAGLDVHKKTVVAALLVPGKKETRTFETMTSDLLALSDWLTAEGVTHVAMESTGEYWKPVFNILENNVEVLLVNAQHIKSVPGRKTDIKDAEWIADLLRHGLLKASFIPPRWATGVARVDPLSHHLCARKGHSGQSDPESIGERQYQAGQCSQ